MKRPARGVTFFRVHITSDGGHDGHWEHNKETLRTFIDNEDKLLRFLNVIHLTMDSLENCYSSYVAEADFDQLDLYGKSSMSVDLSATGADYGHDQGYEAKQ